MKRAIYLTTAERRIVLGALFYYRNDADPTREGDLHSVTAREWSALARALAKIRDSAPVESERPRVRKRAQKGASWSSSP